jgi:hypothetical protein
MHEPLARKAEPAPLARATFWAHRVSRRESDEVVAALPATPALGPHRSDEGGDGARPTGGP